MPTILTVDASPSIHQAIEIVLGGAGCITKPFKPDQILSVTTKLVRE